AVRQLWLASRVAGGGLGALALVGVLLVRWLGGQEQPPPRKPPPRAPKIEERATVPESPPAGEIGASNKEQETKRQELPPASPPATPPRTAPLPHAERREPAKPPALASASPQSGARDAQGTDRPTAAAVSSVFFQCAGAREVCGALRSAVDEALDKAGLRSVRNATKSDVAVDARVTALGGAATQSFGATLEVQSYSIELTAEATASAEAVSMPPAATVSYDPRFGSERVTEKARLVASDVVEKIQAFARKRRR